MDETADDGLAAAGIVRILNDRQDQPCRVTRVPAVGQNSSVGRANQNRDKLSQHLANAPFCPAF